MKNILIFSDTHIDKENLSECKSIFEEIGTIAKANDVDTIIDTGDTFDILKPGSEELDLFSSWIADLKPKYNVNKLIVIAADSHESETKSISIINHFCILTSTVSVYKEFTDGKNLYCGHFGITECPMNYGAKISQKDLAQYKYVFLGHIHSFYQVKNIIGLGSVRYVSFSEWQDKKVVAVITDYKGSNEKLEFIELKSPIPMKQLEIGQTLPKTEEIKPRRRGRPRKNVQPEGKENGFLGVTGAIDILNSLDPNTKVKVIIKDFSSYKQFVNVEDKYKQKFVRFIRVNDFSLISEITPNKAKSKTSLKESFDEFVKEKNVDDGIADIIIKEIK